MLALHPPSTVDTPSSAHRPTSASSSRSHRPLIRKTSTTTAAPVASSSRSAPLASPTKPPRQAPYPSSAPAQQAAPQPPIDIHTYPSSELLRLLASLLSQIAATNDKITPPADTPSPSTVPSRTTAASLLPTDPPIWHTLTTASRTSISTPSATLTFHARNVPTISLEAYLLRILKYCPTTNEVFLSLLVYFDRMSKIALEATGKTFVIDSFNIHRLVIAGVTVASKFFSDVFYTNSRYAKVGGLPQAELNQLELQFLLLNDFRLVVSQDEMQRYAEQLILFSQSEHTGPVTSDALHPPTTPRVGPEPATVPLKVMGAIDAYGGALAQEHLVGTIAGRPRGAYDTSDAPQQPFQRIVAPVVAVPPRQRYEVDSGNETETDNDTSSMISCETGDGGSTTDDEPTIRPAHSTKSSSETDDGSSVYSRDDASLYSNDSRFSYNESMEEEEEEGIPGDATPERRAVDQGSRTPAASKVLDSHMGTP